MVKSYNQVTTPPFVVEEDFGVFLLRMRRRYRMQIIEVVESLQSYLPKWDRFTYSRIESGRRAPRFEELLSLYRGLVLGCGIAFGPDDRQTYLDLARKKIDGKQSHRDRQRSDTDWRLLSVQLAEVDCDPAFQAAHISPSAAQTRATTALPLADIRYIVGRDGWLSEMLGFYSSSAPKKLVVVQGPLGSGKSSCWDLLLRSLVQQDTSSLVSTFHGPRPRAGDSNVSPEEFLEQVIGTLLTELKAAPPGDDAPARPITTEARLESLLQHLAASPQRVVLLIDDGDVLLGEDGLLSQSWRTFLERFLHYQHKAIIYLKTRQWPEWRGKDQAFLEETRLPALYPEDGAQLLRNLGSEFQHLPGALLEQLSERCGGNPFLLECCASLARKPLVTFSWSREVGPGPAEGGEVERALRRMIEAQSVLLREIALERRPLLDEVIHSRISQDAQRLLHILALAAIPLATPLLQSMCQNPQLAIEDLFRASLSRVPGSERVQLLPVVTEAVIGRLTPEEVRVAEDTLIDAFQAWLEAGDFISEQEQSQVITELAALLLKHRRLLDAAQLLIRYGWLCSAFGHSSRLSRLAQRELERPDGGTGSAASDIGSKLLHYHIAPIAGQPVDSAARARDAQRLLATGHDEGIGLTSRTQVRLTHFVVLHLMNTRRFDEARDLIEESSRRLEAQAEDDPEAIATLHAMSARLLGTWSDDAGEQGNQQEALALRRQAAAILQQCVDTMVALEERSPHWTVRQSNLKYRRARYLTNLGYHLGILGSYEQALSAQEESIGLKKAGYAERGSLAAALGEKAQVLTRLGRFQEALDFDQQAHDELQGLAGAGHASASVEKWVYQVDRACLYLRLGRVDEAERLLQEAECRILDRRKEYRIKAQKALFEIEEWRAVSPGYQLDWRWSARYRAAIAYDPFHWLAPAGPFTREEQAAWERLDDRGEQEDAHLRRSALMSASRDRELAASLAEEREPQLHYPAIPLADLKQRQAALLQLAAEVEEKEPNALVRRFYLDAIDEQRCYLRMIQATREGDGTTFFACNRELHDQPGPTEMGSALTYLAQLIGRGLRRPDTEPLSTRLLELLKQFSLPVEPPTTYPHEGANGSARVASNGQMISPATVKRFFEAVLEMYGFEGWGVSLDPSTNDPRIEPNVRSVILPAAQAISVTRIRNLLSHEIESHVFRTVAGERSPLALLGLGTRGSLTTDEGLALYFDRQTALAQGTRTDESDLGFWIGTLATGLASGVSAPPLTFSSLFKVFELVFALNRLLKGIDKDLVSGRARVHSLALGRCLRTFRGVPDLRVAGHAYVKDAIYLRGYRAVAQAVERDSSTLTRLMVGIVALEQLEALKELGIVSPPHPPRWLAHDPQIETFISSFQDSPDHPGVS
jgi:tetratricopeptide (TPR) repeat protein